jgi:hypothetical protein
VQLGIHVDMDVRICTFERAEHDSPGVFVALRVRNTARGNPDFEPIARWTDEGKGDRVILGQPALHGFGVLQAGPG